MPHDVVVIGSGLSALGAIKSLLDKGIRPLVIDKGARINPQLTSIIDDMASRDPESWSVQEKRIVFSREAALPSSGLPRKLSFGSDFFYGKSVKYAPIQSVGNIPPFSYALGGLSAGWGAAVLPPRPCDLLDWPVSPKELEFYCEKIIADLPYSAKEDSLSINFPLLKKNPKALFLSKSHKEVLNWLEKRYTVKENYFIFGQARLLVSPDSSSGHKGCKYCGQCMSGCVYKCIYKAEDEVLDLYAKNKIDYINNCLVVSVAELNDKVVIKYFDHKGDLVEKKCSKVLLAAGAVNSTRIILSSLKKYGKKLTLKSRGGFVLPIFSLRKLSMEWPFCNTQPGIFLEIKNSFLKNWVHIQLSTENEFILDKLGIDKGSSRIINKLKRFIANHTFVALVNFHSNHSGHYNLWVTEADENTKVDTLHSSHEKKLGRLSIFACALFKLTSLFFKIGCIPLIPFLKINSGSYHVGGSIPMKNEPLSDCETDKLGRVNPWKHIHVVDTSVFPSLPGTTIGLLSMANAYRIVDQIDWEKIR